MKVEAKLTVDYIAAVGDIKKITIDDVNSKKEILTIHMDNGLTEQQNLKLAANLEKFINGRKSK